MKNVLSGQLAMYFLNVLEKASSIFGLKCASSKIQLLPEDFLIFVMINKPEELKAISTPANTKTIKKGTVFLLNIILINFEDITKINGFSIALLL
jgi:hypothetical protein